MTIAELRRLIEKYPDELPVLVDGYEGGFAEILGIKESKVELNHYSEEWNGPHEETEKASAPALIIRRAPNENSGGV